MDQTENLLATPNYPQHYSTHLDCTWKLVAPEGHALKLDFRDLDLEAHHSCKHDYLDVQYLDDNGRLLRCFTNVSIYLCLVVSPVNSYFGEFLKPQ